MTQYKFEYRKPQDKRIHIFVGTENALRKEKGRVFVKSKIEIR